jgi:flagella synthesis protein FlgN
MEKVETLLNQQADQLLSLASLLEKELKLISQRKPDALMDLVNLKSEHLERIQNTDKDIDTALQQRTSPSFTDSEKTVFEVIQQRVNECKRQTGINEKALEQSQLRLAHLRQVLMDLRARESLTYDKSGKPKGSSLGGGIKA